MEFFRHHWIIVFLGTYGLFFFLIFKLNNDIQILEITIYHVLQLADMRVQSSEALLKVSVTKEERE